MNKITINTTDGQSYMTNVIKALKTVTSVELINRHNNSWLYHYIEIDNKIIAYYMFGDGIDIRQHDINMLNELNPNIILKCHYSPLLYDYSIYNLKQKIYPMVLYNLRDITFNYNDLLKRKRNIDVVAQMRWFNSGGKEHIWGYKRLELIKQAELLRKKGYNTKFKMESQNDYQNGLLDTKIGFIWSASAYLGWKITEFIQHGVVMITEPLGKEYPICNDIILEDGIHCIFCNEPELFGDIAIEL